MVVCNDFTSVTDAFRPNGHHLGCEDLDLQPLCSNMALACIPRTAFKFHCEQMRM